MPRLFVIRIDKLTRTGWSEVARWERFGTDAESTKTGCYGPAHQEFPESALQLSVVSEREYLEGLRYEDKFDA